MKCPRKITTEKRSPLPKCALAEISQAGKNTPGLKIPQNSEIPEKQGVIEIAAAKSENEASQPAGLPGLDPLASLAFTKENPGAVFGVERPEEIIDLAAPEPRKREFLRGLLSAVFGQNVGDSRPPWARRAFREMWRCLGIVPQTRKMKSENWLFGYFLGLGTQLEKLGKLDDIPALRGIKLPQLRLILFTAIETEPPSHIAYLHQGYAQGLRQQLTLSPTHNFPFYAVLAVAYREVSTAKSLPELHKWLVEIGIFGNEATEVRTRRLCQRIGLRFDSKGGAPKKAVPGPRHKKRWS